MTRDTLDVGGRQLTAFRPPLSANPSTAGFYDDNSGALFSSDCFGGPMPTAELATCDVGHIPGGDLRAAQLLWATVDGPWVHTFDHARYLGTLGRLRDLDPALILSTHLPPAPRRTPEVLQTLTAAPAADPYIGPGQAALEQMLAGLEPRPAAR